MGFYVLTDGNGGYIRHDARSGKYVPVRSLRDAKQWDNANTPMMILNNSVAGSIRPQYHVKLIETSRSVIKDQAVKKQEEIINLTIEDDNIQDWLEKIKIICGALTGTGEREEQLNQKLSEIDRKIGDVNHYIEFGNYNACQGWRCFKMLQQLLRQRRKYKNEIQVLQMIKTCDFNAEAVKNLLEKIEDVANKCYRPREFPELFNGSR